MSERRAIFKIGEGKRGVSKFISRAILVGNARDLNRDFLKIAQTAFGFGQAVENVAAIIHRAVVEARHRLQIKIERPISRGDNFILVVAHNPNRHRIIARDIQSLRAERQLDTFHAMFADVEINRDFLNLNLIAEKFLNVLNRVKPLDAVKSELLFEVLKRNILLDNFAVKIGVGTADEYINQIVENPRGD